MLSILNSVNVFEVYNRSDMDKTSKFLERVVIGNKIPRKKIQNSSRSVDVVAIRNFCCCCLESCNSALTHRFGHGFFL